MLKPARSFGRLPALAALLPLLAACGATGPMWIEAPLLADGSRSEGVNGYRGFEETLRVDDSVGADLDFSLATLPNGSIPRITIAGGTASAGTETYALTADKVFRARLVLFVDRVDVPGHIRIDGLHGNGAPCQASEAVVTSCTQVVPGATLATNADAPAQPLWIGRRGYHSFDVTDLVRQRIGSGFPSLLRVSSVYDLDSGNHGEFRFASKEQPRGQFDAAIRHPQLLVTLTDATGMTMHPRTTTTVATSIHDATVADRDFSLDPDMFANGHPDEPAWALVQPNITAWTGSGVRSLLDQLGTRGYRLTMSSFVNSPFPAPTGPPPSLDWFRIGNFNLSSARITWNNGWSEPDAADLLAVHPIRPDLQNQALVSDLSAAYAAAVVDSHTTNTAVDFALAARTNLPGPVMLDGYRNAVTAKAPRFMLAVTPKIANAAMFTFDQNDSTLPLSVCLFLWSSVDFTDCSNDPLIRARIGQFPDEAFINVDVRASMSAYLTPIDFAVPATGPSIAIVREPAPSDQSPYDNPYSGYVVEFGRANRVTGLYVATVSMPGHNLTKQIRFENLPLPSPTLSGPAQLEMPVGATSTSVAADAVVPFVLEVDDATVNAHVDDTTRWVFTSSDTSDTLPMQLQQTDGQVAFAMTFGSIGTRTIAVRSIGDASISASMQVTVAAQASELFADGFE